MTTSALSSTKDYALRYYDKGFSVFVLKNPETGTELLLRDRKKPAVLWDIYQIMRPSKIQIERWFEKNPDYNVAIVTGSISKIIAFDVDGPNAVMRVEEKRMEMSFNLRVALDATMVNKTGSGGTHIIFKIEDDISDISNKLLWSDGQAHSQILMQGNAHYIVAAPSVHPNGNKYQWNGEAPHLITRQELNEFIRLLSPPGGLTLQSRPQIEIPQPLGNVSTTRTLTPEQMQELLSWIKPYYTHGTRDHIIFYLSGMMRKAGFSLETARRFIKLLCNASGYSDEDLDKSLTVVDNTYRKPAEDLNGKSGLHDLLVTSYESSSEYDNEQFMIRAESYSQICQIINGEPESPDPDDDGSTGIPVDGDNNNKERPGAWLSRIKKTYKDPKDCPAAALLAEQLLKLDHYKTLADTKEILWYRNGIYHYGGQDRIVSRLDEFGGYGVNITIRREVTEYIKVKTLIDREEFDKNPLIRNVKNGVIDLQTGERYPHDPDKYLSLIQIPHDYYTPEEMKKRLASRPKGKQVLCKKIVFGFLYNVLEKPDVRLALEFLGYCLIGDNKKFQKSLMCVGPPDSGKSTFLNITKLYLGEKNMSHKSLMQLTRQRFATADLYGKLANSCADISSSKLENVEVFKLIASGDDISAEKKNRDPFSFTPICKLMFSANTPPLPDDELDDAYYKRWILLVFGMKKAVKINRNLLEEIEQDENELSDLLCLSVITAKNLIRNRWFSGGQRTRDIDVIREEYVRKAVPVKAWVDDNCVFGTNYEGDKAAMFADFNEYCRKEKLPELGSVIALGMKLMDVYPSLKDVKVGKGSKAKHVWKGIALISSLRPEEQTEILGDDKAE